MLLSGVIVDAGCRGGERTIALDDPDLADKDSPSGTFAFGGSETSPPAGTGLDGGNAPSPLRGEVGRDEEASERFGRRKRPSS